MALVEAVELRARARARADVSAPLHVREWLAANWMAVVASAPVLVGIGVLHGLNMAQWPGFGNDDEGTYMARAWAVQTGLGPHHGPANYTYWYDHPPFGWIQLAAWTALTHTFRSGVIAVQSGRGAMLGYTLASAALVYVVARRAGCSRLAANVAMALFGASPIGVQYLRMVWLDSIGLPWLLASFALALSPRRRLGAIAASGVCFAGAVLSKETYLILAPALVWQVWTHADARTRRVAVSMLLAASIAVGVFYPLYALLKGELVPGHGHVSLVGAIDWQLFGRASSGSVFHAGSDANNKVWGWLRADPWLLVGGVALLPVAASVRRLRPLAAAIVIPLLSLLRPGYVPAAFIIGLTPFMALTIAAGGEVAWRTLPALAQGAAAGVRRRLVLRRTAPAAPAAQTRSRRMPGWPALVARGALLAAAGVVAAYAGPAWAASDRVALTADAVAPYVAAEHWVVQHVPRSAVVLTDDDYWIDLVADGYQADKLVWVWELDADPEVQARYRGGWRDVAYIVASPVVRAAVLDAGRSVHSVVQALAHSVAVVRFGSGSSFVEIRRVVLHGPANPPWWLPGYGSMVPPTSGPAKGEQL